LYKFYKSLPNRERRVKKIDVEDRLMIADFGLYLPAGRP
jgi:hypothetical protein